MSCGCGCKTTPKAKKEVKPVEPVVKPVETPKKTGK